ncbi:hypothetical protein [uncultured Sulfitobacter sp.]|uniref:hypothetical protein n=1 Tax=uncultured Sulfitobacter sp. TaxID=191468 RepID=UPI00261E96E1|nr:hypothetical protein [uncultured Sulfitobacter sp.]
MLSRVLCIVGLMSALATPAFAARQFYACDVDAKRSLGWVSPKMGFVFDGKGGVQVIDGVIMHFIGKPVAARVRAQGDTLRITWSISGARDKAGQIIPGLGYIATLNTKTKSVSVISKSGSFPQRFTGKGTCKIRKNAKGFLRG